MVSESGCLHPAQQPFSTGYSPHRNRGWDGSFAVFGDRQLMLSLGSSLAGLDTSILWKLMRPLVTSQAARRFCLGGEGQEPLVSQLNFPCGVGWRRGTSQT